MYDDRLYRAWREGRQDAERGFSLDDNPWYPPDDPNAHTAWNSGFRNQPLFG